jgi:dolichol-phosphate mannosyltransferase
MIHILLPAYNEGEALGAVIEGVARTLADGDYKIWVVDDGSSDGTAAAAERAAAQGLPVKLIRHPRNLGLGAAFRTGLSTVVPALGERDILMAMDADNTHPAQLIPRLAAPIEEGRADVVIASRFAPGGEEVGVPPLRRVLSAGARVVFTLLFGVKGVRDYTCAYRAFRSSLLKEGMARWGTLVTEDGFASSVEWLLRLSALSPRVEEVPLVLRYDRKPGPSKMRIIPTIRRTLGVLRRLRRLRAS